MLPLKWRIFRIASYLHMAGTVVIAALAIQLLFDMRIRFNSWEDILGIALLLGCPAILLANSSINLFLLEKFYPERLPGKNLRRISVILYVFSLIIVAGAIVSTIAASVALSSKREPNFRQNIIPYLLTMDVGVISITGCYILWTQVSLRKSIRRNYEASLNNFLDNDQA